MCLFFREKKPLGPCPTALNKFSNSNGNFIECVLSKAVPVTLCTDCADKYLDAILLYTNVTGKDCRSQFMDHDRLNAIESIYENSLDIWNKAFCDGK